MAGVKHGWSPFWSQKSTICEQQKKLLKNGCHRQDEVFQNLVHHPEQVNHFQIQ